MSNRQVIVTGQGMSYRRVIVTGPEEICSGTEFTVNERGLGGIKLSRHVSVTGLCLPLLVGTSSGL